VRTSRDSERPLAKTGDSKSRKGPARLWTRAWLLLGSLAVLFLVLATAIRLMPSQRSPYVGPAIAQVSLTLALVLTWWAIRTLARLGHKAPPSTRLEVGQSPSPGLRENAQPADSIKPKAVDESERTLAVVEALSRMAQLIASSESIVTMLTAVVEEAVAVLQADAGVIGLWDGERNVFKDVATCNLPSAFIGREFGARDSFTSHVAMTGRVVFLDDYMSYPWRIKELDPFGFRATLGAPLMVKGASMGSLVVLSTSPERRFAPQDGRLLSSLADHAAAALEKARLYRVAIERLRALSQAKGQLATKSRELESALTTLVQVQEQERARIAIDMHDGVVQLMVGSLYEMRAAAARSRGAPEAIVGRQERACALLEDAIKEMRRVILDLRPLTLDLRGLAAAVEALVDGFQQVGNQRTVLRVKGSPYRLSRDAETSAFRIVQEALNNAMKHSQANSAEVTLEFHAQGVELSVVDDGQGIDWEQADVMDGQHVGLRGMRERALSVGGELRVKSVPGVGTTIAATIPRDAYQREEMDVGRRKEAISDAWGHHSVGQ